jgi:hypothetical protein
VVPSLVPPVVYVCVRLVVGVHVPIEQIPHVDEVSVVMGPIKDFPVFLTIEPAQRVYKLVNIVLKHTCMVKVKISAEFPLYVAAYPAIIYAFHRHTNIPTKISSILLDIYNVVWISATSGKGRITKKRTHTCASQHLSKLEMVENAVLLQTDVQLDVEGGTRQHRSR